MDTLYAIFAQLGIDGSIAIQFTTALLAFIACKILFLDKLQEVLQIRLANTEELKARATAQLVEAENYSEKYRTLVNKAYGEARDFITDQKGQVTAQEDGLVKETEKACEKRLDQAREQFEKEKLEKKNKLMLAKEELAKMVLEKVSR